MKKLNAVGANIFAGGFTVGVSKHFNILAHLEHDDYGVEVTKANFDHPVFIGTGSWPEEASKGKPINFLYSNPPCAIWSLAGNKQGRIDWRLDPRLQRVRDIFGLVKRYRPEVWCWESVCQAFEKGREFVEEIAAEAAKLGYSASYVLIDAMYLGAPMTRKRFFLVLHRVPIDWAKHMPDFTKPPLLPRDALKGVKPDGSDSYKFVKTAIGKQMDRVLRATPPGGRLGRTFEDLCAKGKIKHVKTDRGTTLGKPSFLAYRINPDKVCGVLFGDKTFHHTEPRHLALNELGVLHGFPKDYDWVSNRHRLDIQRGVLPPVGEWLAGAVADAIRAASRKRAPVAKPTRTLVDFRTVPGAIRPVDALPRDVDLNWRPGKARDDTERPRKRASADTPLPRTGDRRPPEAAPSKPLKNQGVTSKPPKATPKVAKSPIRIKDLGDPKALLRALAAGTRPASSGALIRARILEGKLDDETMAAEVRKLWPGRVTSKSDVAWNRGQLRKSGALT